LTLSQSDNSYWFGKVDGAAIAISGASWSNVVVSASCFFYWEECALRLPAQFQNQSALLFRETARHKARPPTAFGPSCRDFVPNSIHRRRSD
jgi:hypothetical protein